MFGIILDPSLVKK